MTHKISKRDMMCGGAALGLSAAASGLMSCAQKPEDKNPNAGSVASDTPLKSITTGAVPISANERKARIAKAAKLMQDAGIGALVIEAGSSLTYFTGIRWWRSERFTGAVITQDGDFSVVTPFFEEPSIREQMTFGEDVRTWHENENPFALVSQYLSEKGVANKPVAIEDTVRHFISHGIRESGANLEIVSGNAITRGCRMYKSKAEIALMQIANDVTMAAYRYIYPRVEVGMTPKDISGLMNKATTQLGASVKFSMALLGKASAYPHGTGQAQEVVEGGVILMDCGADVYDYESDISRTWVMGEPSKLQREVWDTVKRGQEMALEAAQIGAAAGHVDDVVRAYYVSKGYGPAYAAPGLTHRLGHGIGMDGHEPVNFVQGETQALMPGMCFSNEPGIYLPEQFGVRLEDCLYMTETGPKLFSEFAGSLDNVMNI